MNNLRNCQQLNIYQTFFKEYQFVLFKHQIQLYFSVYIYKVIFNNLLSGEVGEDGQNPTPADITQGCSVLTCFLEPAVKIGQNINNTIYISDDHFIKCLNICEHTTIFTLLPDYAETPFCSQFISSNPQKVLNQPRLNGAILRNIHKIIK